MRTAALAALLGALGVLIGCSKDKGSSPTTPNAPLDKDRLQGVWAVESVECGVELDPKARQRMMDWRVHVHESRFSVGAGEVWELYTFATDTGKEPKKLLLHEAPPESKAGSKKGGIPKAARARGWLYKFEGDKLILAFLRGNDSDSVPPPEDFKIEPGQNVVVLRLVKTNDEPRTNWDTKPADGAKK